MPDENFWGLSMLGVSPEWEAYRKAGGILNYHTWLKHDKPPPQQGQLTPYAAKILERTGGIPPGVTVPTDTLPSVTERIETESDVAYAMYASQGGTLSREEWDKEGKPTTVTPTEGQIPLPEGMPEEWTNQVGQKMRWDSSRGDYVQIGFDPKGVYKPEEEQELMPKGMYATYGEADSAAPEGYVPIQTPEGWWTLQRTPTAPEPTTYEQFGQDPYGGQGQFNPYTGQWEQPTGWISPYQQQQLDLQQQDLTQQQAWQQGQLEAQKQAQLANLRANPSSWLEYASLAGETPAVQPWMSELSPQTTAWQTGAALPGYSPTGESMNLQQLTTPSAQYMSRIAPSSRQQYGGYEKARTGQTLQDVDWLRWQGSPPAGSFSGLSRLR